MSAAEQAIAAARNQLGVSYSWGGGGINGPSQGFGRGAGITGFDCSSLVQYAYAKAGIKLPRVAKDQQAATESVKNPRPGDLVFYGAPAHHVGLYIGGGQMIAAPRTGERVKVQPVYNAGDGPLYGRVPGSGAGSVVAGATIVAKAVGGKVTGVVGGTVGKAADAAADAATGAAAAVAGDVIRAAQPVLIKAAVLGLGLVLIGAGVIRATGARPPSGLDVVRLAGGGGE